MSHFDPNPVTARSSLMIVLDTDYMSLLQWSKGTNRLPFLERARSLEAEHLAMTIVTYEEQTRGKHRRLSPQPRRVSVRVARVEPATAAFCP